MFFYIFIASLVYVGLMIAQTHHAVFLKATVK